MAIILYNTKMAIWIKILPWNHIELKLTVKQSCDLTKLSIKFETDLANITKIDVLRIRPSRFYIIMAASLSYIKVVMANQNGFNNHYQTLNRHLVRSKLIIIFFESNLQVEVFHTNVHIARVKLL
jgi:hypothetical protein